MSHPTIPRQPGRARDPKLSTLTAGLALLLAAGLLLDSGAAAEEATTEPRRQPDPETLEPDVEVVVTATFRDTVARDVPASVVILGEEDVRDTSSNHFEEISTQVPNLHFSGEGNRARYWQIRGIGEREQYTGAPNPSVGFVVDDVDLSGIGGIATLWDVDRIEVLRGPQGTRFGASALAGAVYLQSAAPSDEFEWNGEVRLGSDESSAIGVAMGGPVGGVERLTYRLSVHRLDENGHRDNRFLGADDTNRRRETTVRGKLRWQPAESWTYDLTGFYVDVDDGYDAFAIDNGLETQSDRPGRDAQRTLAGSLRATGTGADAFTVIGISSASDSDGIFSFDADWGNEEFWSPYTYDFFSETRRQRRTLSQEVRLVSTPSGRWAGGRIGWVTGVHASRLSETNRTRDDGIYLDPAFPADPFTLDSAIQRDYRAESLSIFGELSMDATPRSTVVVGLRGERRAAEYRDDAGNAFDPDESMLGGQLTWTRALGPERNVYARIARGYKAGGFNLGLPPEADDEQRLYEAEYLWNYEVGFKGRRSGGDAAWDLVGFWSDRRRQQVETSIQLDPNNPTTFLFFTDNAGRGKNFGVEASGSLQVTTGLRLRGQVGWLETEIDRFGSNTALAGRDQAHAPRLSYSAGGTWRDRRGRFARVDVVGATAYYFDTSHDQRSEPYALVHLRFGVEHESWAAYLWARNLFDTDYATRGFFFGNEPPAFENRLYVKRGDPRQAGIAVRFVY